jgi:para-nitrobenzyl esterase
MFWCHGGAWSGGSGAEATINGEALARRGDVVMVTINHRINVFGFCNLADIGGEKYAASGLVGMLDLIAGLHWVHENIARFGGDPGNVMIFGESGGGLKTSTLLAMPGGKGLYHRAAIESGALLRSDTREHANVMSETLIEELGITRDRIDEIQKIPADRLLSAMNAVGVRLNTPTATLFCPFVDGKYLPTNPFDPVATPVSDTIPILVGWNTHEQAMFQSMGNPGIFDLDEAGLRQRIVAVVGEQKAPDLIALYKRKYPGSRPSELLFLMLTDEDARMSVATLAERKYQQGKAPVFVYLFAWRSTAQGGRMGAPHGVEVQFVFDNTGLPNAMTTGTPAEKDLAARMSEAWIHFARTGNPNHSGLPNWPAYTPKDRSTMVFDTECKMINDPQSEERQYWQNFLANRAS